MAEVLRPAKEHDSVHAHGVQQVVDQAHGLAEEHVQQGHQHHRGDEMRRVGDHLHGLLEPGMLVGIEQQRQDDRDREAHQQRVQADHEGVGHQRGEIEAVYKFDKVLHAHPAAAGDAKCRIIVAESDLQTVHGPIFKEQIEQNAGNDHQVQIIIFDQVLPQILKKGVFFCAISVVFLLRICDPPLPPEDTFLLHFSLYESWLCMYNHHNISCS